LVDPGTGGRVLRISQDGQKGKLFFMMRGTELDDAPNDPIVLFRETPAGTIPALQGWVYAGEVTPFEFVYSHRQAQALGGAKHPTVDVAAGSRILVGSRGNGVMSARKR
jgi:hypothetical protein